MSHNLDHSRWSESAITALSLLGILAHLAMRYGWEISEHNSAIPLLVVLILGGIPLLIRIVRQALARDLGTDLLAGVSIVASLWMGEYLAGSVIVLMFSGGHALEQWASRRASAVLDALAKRMPQIAHRLRDGTVSDTHLADVAVGDLLVVFPQEICPVDGVVTEGHGRMDESYLTGEPFEMAKTPGTQVFSGAINKDTALTIRAEKLAVDSRYAKIMQVMRAAEQDHPRLRRLADQFGAWYAPLALALAGLTWVASGEERRFLAVLVVATPCPLLIAVPVAVIGAISLAAKRSIIIKNPSVLELISTCKTIIFDKTGTLTYGRPTLTEVLCAKGFSRPDVLRAAASLERYSKHPLAGAILRAAEEEKIELDLVSEVSEKPGEGLRGVASGRSVQVTGRHQLRGVHEPLPPVAGGLECVVLIGGVYAAIFRFRDAPREESRLFIQHLSPHHEVTKVMLVSGDRESEVRYLADEVGIEEVHASRSPEDKLALVKRETAAQKTLFIGDGINDAPALMAATVGIAFGQSSDITSEAADAVILEPSLEKVDELFHIGRRMRAIALQSALGGMAASFIGMGIAAAGHLTPVQGAVLQEIIDLVAVLNAVRTAIAPKRLTDYSSVSQEPQ